MVVGTNGARFRIEILSCSKRMHFLKSKLLLLLHRFIFLNVCWHLIRDVIVVFTVLLNSLTCQGRELKSAVTKHTDKEIIAEHKKKEREAAKKGKRPYYLKKCNSPCCSPSYFYLFHQLIMFSFSFLISRHSLFFPIIYLFLL